MEIIKHQESDALNIALVGRLDTNTAPKLEKELEQNLNENIKNLFFDFKDLEYVSSAGLRILLSTQKKISEISGIMKIKNVAENVREIFKITGFLDILTLE